MSGDPSIAYDIEMYGDQRHAKIYNTKFPDQMIELPKDIIQDLNSIMGLDPYVECKNILYEEYKAKYMQ